MAPKFNKHNNCRLHSLETKENRVDSRVNNAAFFFFLFRWASLNIFEWKEFGLNFQKTFLVQKSLATHVASKIEKEQMQSYDFEFDPVVSLGIWVLCFIFIHNMFMFFFFKIIYTFSENN